MDRYSLAWGSLGALALAATASWYMLSAALPPAPPYSSTIGQPVGSEGPASRLWPPPPALAPGAGDGAPKASTSPSVVATTASQPLPNASPQDGVLHTSFVVASLQALAAHGVRLHQAQVSLHTVQTADRSAARALSRWARSQGFAVRPPIELLEHGGEVNWLLPIERHAVLDVAQIVADGKLISARAQQTPGARYHTWQVPLNGQSTLARASQS